MGDIMKKVLSIFLCFIIALASFSALAGCSKQNAKAFDVVFVTDGASVEDKSYNKNTWNGVKKFAQENNLSCRYYQPTLTDGELTEEAVKNYVKLSVDNGAKYIVVQGEAYNGLISSLANEFSDVNFVAAGVKLDEPISNVMTISFDELQAGYLAGYASVELGCKKLGYLGSVIEASSLKYGAGYVQGAADAADALKTTTILSYANYDDPNLSYDYSFVIKPVYKAVSECKEETFKVEVINGIGSGVYTDGENVTIIANPAPQDKVFDHWEKKSTTEGKSDKKVNINSTKNKKINLLVGDCDCILEAVYTDAKTSTISIKELDLPKENISYVGEPYAVSEHYALQNTQYEVKAPAAQNGMRFSHWQCEDGVVEDINDAWAKVNVAEKDIELVAVYEYVNEPTYNVFVENGTGTGAYMVDDYVEIVADPPQEGYMFYKWENLDKQGLPSGVQMENEYNYNTSFDMIDRSATLVKAFYNDGVDVVFGGGNPHADSIFTANSDYTFDVYGFGWGIDQGDKKNCIASVVTDYETAIYNSLNEFKGGSNYVGNCSNQCLYVTNIDNEDHPNYKNAYDSLAQDKLKLSTLGKDNDVRKIVNSKCLTLKYYIR